MARFSQSGAAETSLPDVAEPYMTRILLVAPVLLLAVACGNAGGGDPKPAAPAAAPAAAPKAQTAAASVTPEAAKEAAEIFASRCTACHGPNGAGDGPASAGLTPPPRNLQDKAWQSSVTDEHIEKIVSYGGAAVGKSPAMPPNPDLASKPATIAALRAHVRNLAK